MKRTIKDLHSDLCSGCGTCAGLCPNSAIEMLKNKEKYVPVVFPQKCNYCGFCFDICPGQSIDFMKLNSEIFQKIPDDIIGNNIRCYTGRSQTEVHELSTSGGLISELLIFALEEGIIDGALVTKMNIKKPFDPEIFVARSKSEILSAVKSKYCPVPVNYGLKEIINIPGKYAVVGLPCHINAIRKAESKNKLLLKKIILHFGIICNHSPTFEATKFLLKKMKVVPNEVKRIEYRSRGWPGGLSIHLKNNSVRFLRLNDPLYWGHVFNYYFIPQRCILCNDKVCELSDISFGDAWFSEFEKNKLGTSIIISRSNFGQDLIENASLNGRISLSDIDFNKVNESQALHLVKRRYTSRFFVANMLHKKIPMYNQEIIKSTKKDFLKAFYIYYSNYVSSHEKLWPLIDLDPFMLRNKIQNQLLKRPF